MPTWIIKTARLLLVQGDITKAPVDAIVNAANSMLQGGGGVDGAIHRAAGLMLLDACREIVSRDGPLATGKAVITQGFNLPARHVIHTVGPVWSGGTANEESLLCSAYTQCMRLARLQGCVRIAFPAISCGAYGYPQELAAPVALSALRHALGPGLPREAELWLHDEQAFNFWCGAASSLFGPPQLP